MRASGGRSRGGGGHPATNNETVKRERGKVKEGKKTERIGKRRRSTASNEQEDRVLVAAGKQADPDPEFQGSRR